MRTLNDLHVVTFRKKVRDLGNSECEQLHFREYLFGRNSAPQAFGFGDLIHKSTFFTDQQPSKGQFRRADGPNPCGPLSLLLQLLHEIF